MTADKVLERVKEHAAFFSEQAQEAEELGRLPDETAKALRDIGVVRLLQPKRYGGYEADVRVFFEAVMAIAAQCGSSGWVSGIVGVHPWQLAAFDDRLQQEVWGDDPDTWVSSQYMPGGMGRRVDGGYLLSGRWGFSSGSDHAEWVVLTGIVGDAEGAMLNPPEGRLFYVRRPDYRVEANWDVVGLRGTGSHDIVIEDVFVPEYRTLLAMSPDGPGLALNTNPLFRVPWATVFPNAITAAVIGIAEGALAAHLEYQKGRVSPIAGPVAESPMMMSAIGVAASDIHASRLQLLNGVGEVYDLTMSGQELPMEMRARIRRDQVQGSWRAVNAVDQLFARSGGNAVRRNNAVQRFWRDAHAGMGHAINVPDKAFHSYAAVAMGFDPIDMMT